MHRKKIKICGRKALQEDFQELDYDTYYLSFREWIWLIGRTGTLLLAVGYLFYNSLYSFLFFIPALIFMYFLERRRRIVKRSERLVEQFKDAIILLYSFISTGSTLEYAFLKASKELLLSYRPEDDIVREFEVIKRKLDMNITIEECMEDFAQRSMVEDIENFSQVIAIAKRGGGSMTAIIKSSVETIKTKIESENEIRTLVSAKGNEFKLMVVIPVAVLLYMRLFSGGFMDALYGNIPGIIFMTICLAVYIAAVFGGFRILDIHV